MKNKNKKIYTKPLITSINIDNTATILMVSEGTIPDNPPWDTKNNLYDPQNDPYKGHSV